jgi:hypothetical protein
MSHLPTIVTLGATAGYPGILAYGGRGLSAFASVKRAEGAPGAADLGHRADPSGRGQTFEQILGIASGRGARPIGSSCDAESDGHPGRAPQRVDMAASLGGASVPAPPMLAQPARSAEATNLGGGLSEFWPLLVRRIAWSGDTRRGCVRLELGAGPLTGGTLFLRSEEGRVHVKLNAPPGVDLEGWRVRIAARLAARGLALEGVEVD